MTISSGTPAEEVDVETAVYEALRGVDDPEYPGLSIMDLGLVESVRCNGSEVRVGLVPTFSGCPALAMIASDVVAAVEAASVRHGAPEAAEGGSGPTGSAKNVTCTVEWLPAPVWSTDRLTDRGKEHLAAEFTVVLRSKNGALKCPVCGSEEVTDQSIAGATRCRSVAWCASCRNPVEVMR